MTNQKHYHIIINKLIIFKKIKPNEGEARVGPCVDYAAYQEFGTSKMAAHPYLTPAFEKVRTKFEDGTTFKELCE